MEGDISTVGSGLSAWSATAASRLPFVLSCVTMRFPNPREFRYSSRYRLILYELVWIMPLCLWYWTSSPSTAFAIFGRVLSMSWYLMSPTGR